jgi:hypothetical protein
MEYDVFSRCNSINIAEYGEQNAKHVSMIHPSLVNRALLPYLE